MDGFGLHGSRNSANEGHEGNRFQDEKHIAIYIKVDFVNGFGLLGLFGYLVEVTG